MTPSATVRCLRRAARLSPALTFSLVGSLALGACGRDAESGTEAADGSRAPGLVVERVAPGLAGERAGIEPGDVLLSWTLHSVDGGGASETNLDGGRLTSSFDLLAVITRHAPRGELRLSGRRGDAGLGWSFDRVDNWGLRFRPEMTPPLAAAYTACTPEVAPVLAGDPEAQADCLSTMIASAPVTADPLLESFLLVRAGAILARSRDSPHHLRAIPLYTSAQSLLAEHGDQVGAYWPLLMHGTSAYFGSRIDEAAHAWSAALEVARQAGAPLCEADISQRLGTLENRRGDPEAALEHLRRASALYQRHAPGSMPLARTLSTLGRSISDTGGIEEARSLFQRSLSLRETLLPQSSEVAHAINDLGVLATRRGDLPGAQSFFEHSSSLWRDLAPDSSQYALALSNLGAQAAARGDFGAAQRAYLESLERYDRLGQRGLGAASALGNLANVALELGQLERARSLVSEALEIHRREIPESADHAFSLERLARVAELDGNVGAARTELEHVLAIRRRLDGGSAGVARTLARLAELARQAGDLGAASRAATEAQSLLEERAPGAPAHGGALQVRAEIARDRGQHLEALRLGRQALTILERVVPDTRAVAQVHHGLARSLQARGDSAKALERYEQALQVFERQVRRVGDALDRARFADRFAQMVQEYVDLLIELGLDERAFEVSERMRARQARVQLESRDTVLAGMLGS